MAAFIRVHGQHYAGCTSGCEASVLRDHGHAETWRSMEAWLSGVFCRKKTPFETTAARSPQFERVGPFLMAKGEGRVFFSLKDHAHRTAHAVSACRTSIA